MLTEPARLVERLVTAGFSASVATAKAEWFARCIQQLRVGEDGDAAPRPWLAYFIPGRIEVLGKHTDYAGGSSLVCAVERGFCLVASASSAARVELTDCVRDETVAFELDSGLTVPAADGNGGPGWRVYPLTVARRLARNFPGMNRGVRIAFASDLPAAAGMSSSSAFMVAVFHALADANALWHHPPFRDELRDPLHLAGYLGTVENGQDYGRLTGDRGVGTFGGSEDHTAMLCARPGAVSQYAYCPVRFERHLPLPAGCVFAVASSGVVAEKTGAARERFNRASRLAAALSEIWRQQTGRDDAHLAAVVRSAPDAAVRLREIVAGGHAGFNGPELARRLEHFLVENEQVIPAAGDALWRGDLVEFGRQVERSQRAAEDLLGNQVPETSHLAAAARRAGAWGASSFGAGFGGSVWALVDAPRAVEFLEAWRADYERAFPHRAAQAEFFTTAAGPAAFRL